MKYIHIRYTIMGDFRRKVFFKSYNSRINILFFPSLPPSPLSLPVFLCFFLFLLFSPPPARVRTRARFFSFLPCPGFQFSFLSPSVYHFALSRFFLLRLSLCLYYLSRSISVWMIINHLRQVPIRQKIYR